MRRGLLLLALLAALASSAALAQGPADTRAAGVVDDMMKALGGPAGWERTRYLRFDWVVERDAKIVANVRHLWDRYEGRYRVEWESKEGNKIVALFNVNTRTGRVFLNGEPVRDEDEQKYLDQAYARFINDCYWLLMPWKLKDPGVNLKYEGETKLGEEAYDLLHVSFQGVGLTPGDHYWAFINRRTRLMDRWAYFLQDFKGKPALDKATPWEWKNWEQVGGIRLARDKVRVGENARIYFPVLMAPATVDAAVFESLQAALPGPAPAAK